ncbi:MAG: tRNA (adenosine(37)-N6)-threonylcarbamoyltransferase complex ATPase subunit type 1 TsaE [Treponema sp.]|nr:tRNA (adenosine(37)-N6)-threonylcarbamoyltransferase complex ATPase subunit type 1 TsaE [Treponema sp.]MCL2251196.1 tRNA (adenosine(37)-N6)-threonylcarbamoyltransferase complex ATPase subunit type 1 TsaE [Treponema sp.]
MKADSPIYNSEKTFISNSQEETLALGKKIASDLKQGSVVALYGTLGSGKTILAKGIALGLGITENLTSPTYTIINEYDLKNYPASLYHIDVYRLENEKDFEDIGGIEILNSNGICIIEWSERILKSLPADAVKVSFEITGDNSRVIKISYFLDNDLSID